jgi:amidohydrolase
MKTPIPFLLNALLGVLLAISPCATAQDAESRALPAGLKDAIRTAVNGEYASLFELYRHFHLHACGHDVHMTSLIGTARVLAKLKDRWKGTAVLIGQPAEERVSGAVEMLKAGLFTRFPKPNYCIALHVNAELPAGSIGYTEGFFSANVDTLDILVRGVGGHGAWPHATRDPVVLAAQVVLALQTIVSRERDPLQPMVITVGSIHGGTKHNIISDEVKLQLTIRTYSDEVRSQVLAAITRIVNGLATAAGVPADRMPVIKEADDYTPTTYNDPRLTRRLAAVFRGMLGEGNVIERKPMMGGEDFGQYGRTQDKIPICMFMVGAVTPESVKESMRSGKSLPSLHSGLFAPAPEPTIKTGISVMTAAVLDLMGR